MRAAVILAGSGEESEESIIAALERDDIGVIRISDSVDRFPHDADALAAGILAAARTVPAGIALAYLGTGVGAAGALIAAAEDPEIVSAVVSGNGRTDLAIDSLRSIRAPVLLVVNDMPVLRMNREALSFLRGERRLEIVHGSEPQAVAQLVEKMVRWMSERLSTPQPSAAV